MSRLQSCSRSFEKFSAVAEKKNSGKSDIFRRIGRTACIKHIHEAICISMTATLRVSAMSVAESIIAEWWQVGK
jgi:hypothetical protein